MPFNKEIIQLVFTTPDCNQNNIEMLISAIDSKIVFYFNSIYLVEWKYSTE